VKWPPAPNCHSRYAPSIEHERVRGLGWYGQLGRRPRRDLGHIEPEVTGARAGARGTVPQQAFEDEAPGDPGANEDDEVTIRRLQALERRLSLLTTAYARRAGETEAGQEPSPSQADGAPRGWSRLSARDSA